MHARLASRSPQSLDWRSQGHDLQELVHVAQGRGEDGADHVPEFVLARSVEERGSNGPRIGNRREGPGEDENDRVGLFLVDHLEGRRMASARLGWFLHG